MLSGYRSCWRRLRQRVQLGERWHHRCWQGAGTQRVMRLVDIQRLSRRLTAWLVKRILWIDTQAHFLSLGPVFTVTTRQVVQLDSQLLEALGVTTLGIDLQQLDANGQAIRRAAQCFLEDFLCLQVTAVCQIYIGFSHWIDITDGIQLAQRVAHGRRTTGRITGIHALTTASAKERIRLQTAFQEGRLTRIRATARAQEHADTSQQGQTCTTGSGQWQLMRFDRRS